MRVRTVHVHIFWKNQDIGVTWTGQKCDVSGSLLEIPGITGALLFFPGFSPGTGRLACTLGDLGNSMVFTVPRFSQASRESIYL